MWSIMNVIIKKLTDNPKLLVSVQNFLFKQIKMEMGYDYVPEWHQDIIHLLALGHMIRILLSLKENIQKKALPASGDCLLIRDIGVVDWLLRCSV